ncbi:unnamed protein product [Ambrosiozyma monospora]|uniref:Unnamed protein product n=1 Tax=Ambrosiozyma monospora TaxID=43982 RepID=A0ACB5SYA6_AMBMO|nr:unnamed protein product [Ambrosiozyma monospora]
MFIADVCTVPGSCSCNPEDCKCEGCVEHDPKMKSLGLSIQQQFQAFPFPELSNQSQHQTPALSTTQQTQPSLPQQVSSSYPTSTSLNLDGHIIPYGQVQVQSAIPLYEQNILRMLMEQNCNTSSSNPFIPSSSSTAMMGITSPQSTISDAGSATNSNSNNTNTCCCEADECACYDCDVHGIVNGVRVSDGVRVAFENDGSGYSAGNGNGVGVVSIPIDDQLLLLDTAAQMGFYSTGNVNSNANENGNGNGLAPGTRIVPENANSDENMDTNTTVNGNVDQEQQQTQTQQIQGKIAHDVIPPDFLQSLSFPDGMRDECMCPEDACFCTNCFKHGRFGNVNVI